MADFSRECGISVSEEQVDACLADQADASSEDLPFCRDFGGAQAIDDTLSCDDLDLFWGDEIAGGGS
ncbi:MAG: hypothetical protein AAF602_12175 [Myxococcota bacterium]